MLRVICAIMLSMDFMVELANSTLTDPGWTCIGKDLASETHKPCHRNVRSHPFYKNDIYIGRAFEARIYMQKARNVAMRRYSLV